MEKNLIVDGRTLNYKGIFQFEELLQTIASALKDLGYQPLEKKYEEAVYPSGKKIYLELRPFKAKTHYVTLMIKLRIGLDKVTEVTKEVDGIKRKFQQGDVNILFDSWSITDYAGRWGMKPLFWFLKAVINKYFYKFPLEESFFGELKNDTSYLYNQLKARLNLYKYQAH